jgi:hypothetical protein
MRRRQNLGLVLLAAVALAACKDSQAPPVPGSLTIAAGDQQSATVGTALPTAPAALLKDTKGRVMKSVDVTFAVTAGGGSLAGTTTVKTGTDGVARAGTWTLGTSVAPNTVTATVQGLPALVFTATANVGAPASMVAGGGDGQSATVGTAVPIAPAVTVKDAFGNGVPNVTVAFAVASGGGSVTGAVATTNAAGTAQVGGWTLGTTIGANTLTATVTGGITQTFTATGTAGPATQMAIFAGNGQTSAVSSNVAVRPAVIVRDQYNNPVAGTSVTFSVTSGGGSITGAIQTTGSNGVATVGSWQLGSTPGPNSLNAQATGLTSVDFTATATEVLVFTMTANGGDGQSAPARWSVGTAPSVKIVDQFGNPGSGQVVTFSVTLGGGSLTGATATTDASGIATVGWWRLGSAIGANSLTAAATGVTPVNFTATATAAPASNGYDIAVAYVAPPTAAQHQAVVNAVTRWQQVVTGDLSNFSITNGATVCTPALVNEPVDDLLLLVDFKAIDGVGNTLGQAGPCFIRQPIPLTIVGLLRLDAADLANMETNGTMGDVIIHEIGHVLGIGTLWNQPPNTLRIFTATDSVTFNGAAAVAAFLANGGNTFAGPPVPVENCKTSAGVPIPQCGAGTQDSHWREAVLGRELMTGFISAPGTSNPLSAVTIQSLADMGYTVNVGVADGYTVGLKPIPGMEAATIHLKEAKPDWPVQILNGQ